VATIQPRTLQGFRDFLPDAMLARESIMDGARAVFRSFGFRPIDTPALEYLDILTGKGGEETDRQLYRFEDHGGRQVGMRFDLTVPLARYVAQHIGKLGVPFKRYHLGTVWRGERAQRGRYREFMQCDFDTIGTSSLVADAEIVIVIHELLRAIDVGPFVIRVNNRKVLGGILARHGIESDAASVLRALDKLPKIGHQGVAAELHDQVGLSSAQSDAILEFAERSGTPDTILSQLAGQVRDSELACQGLEELEQVVHAARAGGVPADRLELDLSIARGLDYYTGTIYETFLVDLPAIGSICSGGRYDDLAGLYTRESLPGVGASLGLDRLLAALEELGRLQTRPTPTQLLVAYFDPHHLHDYLQLATAVRRRGIAVEVYPEPKKLKAQLKYADRQHIPWVLIAGEREFAEGKCQVKELATGESHLLPWTPEGRELAEFLTDRLAGEARS